MKDRKIIHATIFEELSAYTVNINVLNNPSALPFVQDLKPYYQKWLIESFKLSTKNAQDLAANLPDYFGYEIYRELKDYRKRYSELLVFWKDPIVEQWALQVERSRYKQQLKAHYRMPALGEKDMALMDVYVDPSFGVYDAILTEEAQETIRNKCSLSRQQQHFLPIALEGGIHRYLLAYFVEKRLPSVMPSCMEAQRLLILLGQPGHGKSSFCYRSCYDLLNTPTFNGNPFFIRLQNADRNILDNPKSNILDLLPAEIKAANWIKKQHQQKTVLFLDGLDELYMTQSLSDMEVLRFIDNCKKWINNHPNLYLVITSRFNYIETSKLFNEDCLIFDLGKLNETQQKELVDKYKARRTDKSCNLSVKAIENINKNDHLKHLKELIELPILLQMILISEINIEENQSKVKIYDNLFETVLNRKWAKDKRLKKYIKGKKFQPKHLQKYLAWLAFKIFQNKQGYINKSEIEQEQVTETFVRKYLTIKNKEGNLRDVLKDILTSFYLKETRKSKKDNKKEDRHNDYAIEFLHKSLYEYLACKHIWTEIKTFFTKKDEDGDFENHSTQDVQKKIQSLFALTRFTTETIAYLKEIIASDTTLHDELTERMSFYLPKLLRAGFIYEFRRSDTHKTPSYLPEEQVIHCFYGYVLIWGDLNQYKIKSIPYINNDKGRIDFRKQGQLVFKEKIEAVEKEKDSFLRLLRLTSSTRLLTDITLSFFDFSHKDLLGLVALKIDLRGAYLRGADLRGADLSGADLRGADFSEAYFSDADLRDADLRDADLRDAIVNKLDWIENLKEQNIKGYGWIIENYRVNPTLESITDIYGNEYKGYRLIKN